MIWFLLLVPIYSSHAGFSEVSESQLYDYKNEKRTPMKSVKKRTYKKKHSYGIDKALNKIIEQDKQIASLLEKQKEKVILKKSNDKISALTRLRGTLLNSVLAMNIRPAKFIVRIDSDLPELESGELRCLGIGLDKRVPTKCDLLVLDGEEYPVDVEIWDLDGAEGIISDYFYSGEEKSFLTSSLASFLQGTLDVAKDRISTPFGNVDQNNAKNRVLGGLIGIAENARKETSESGEQTLTISYINSGKEVLVFFNQSLLLK